MRTEEEIKKEVDELKECVCDGYGSSEDEYRMNALLWVLEDI